MVELCLGVLEVDEMGTVKAIYAVGRLHSAVGEGEKGTGDVESA